MPEFINPIEILDQLDLRSSMIAADFGCGSGGWTIPLGRILDKGRVYAVDIQEDVLSSMLGKAKLFSVFNIKKVIADVEVGVPEIKDYSCDIVLLTDLLFQVEDKQAVFREANRALKPEAKLLIVDWNPGSRFGPKEGRISKEEAKDLAMNNGFRFQAEIPGGDYHYCLVFVKQ